ncbi:ABC transporter ATP-binding protein [Paraliobacillus sediminis]|uniref:ABC transporter ATP-binding protein n=1 Tax=Paraliobacillus sediminis TaxID=1885916 RepID=UPI000E3ED5D1|nr:dipeptide/oligopeptide/nickel ABC transporter ATP-binding protein [Paraliobacillus sediminis]
MAVLQAKSIYKTYNKDNLILNNVNVEIEKGKCFGLVGESGSGKSTLARCLLGIERIDSGSIVLNGVQLQGLNERKLREHRIHMQAVFQNPTASLNPKLKIKESMIDPYMQFKDELNLTYFNYENKEQYINKLLEAVELPSSLANRYPHELSGGQKQRVTIARALSIEPELLILDEPTASLDVLSQGAILKLLTSLRKQIGMAYLFISHDLAAVSEMSQDIMVMKEGSVVDSFSEIDLFSKNRNNYTKELIELFV